ncbi:MAG TPA: hypothetical protein PKD29_02275 [Rhodocyclaceae bacterium]|nr:hypothetical protein [Rhodocyclaceae bacterium]
MNPFGLPPLANDHPPDFSDAAHCRKWLAGVPLNNPAQAQVQLLRQLHLLNRHDLAAGARIEILEALRQPVIAVQETGLKRFAGKALPLAAGEEAAFEATQNLWQALADGYLRCIEAWISEARSDADRKALAAERALAALGAKQLDIYRGGRQPAPPHWRLLHAVFRAAEDMRVTGVGVAEEEGRGASSTPMAAYAAALLLHLASPHEFTPRQLAWVVRWARRWSGKVVVGLSMPSDPKAIPVCVDLASDQPAGYMPRAGDGARWLDPTELRRSVKTRIVRLDKGESPASLQLGDDCTQPACGEVLNQVYQRWCRGGLGRRQDRRPADGGCEFVCDIPAIHYYLSGRKPFKQPGMAGDDLLRIEREEIATFGRISTRREENFSVQQGFELESWQVLEDWSLLNESATGVRIARNLRQPGHRVAPGQLVAVRPADARAMLLGMARWVMAGGDGMLHAGVQFFPGQAESVALRSTGLTAVREPYRPGFLLPAIAALDQPATVVLPTGWFRVEGVVEVFTDRARQIRLVRLVERGADFERAEYKTTG